MAKCKICGAPMSGFISKLFGLRPSTKKPGVCNKCENKPEKKPVKKKSKK